jgi:hypothetical protein
MVEVYPCPEPERGRSVEPLPGQGRYEDEGRESGASSKEQVIVTVDDCFGASVWQSAANVACGWGGQYESTRVAVPRPSLR